MIKNRIPKGYRRAYWLWSRAALVGSAVIGSYLLIGFTTFPIQPRLTATGIIASTLLTFALIAVYRDIGEIQAEQAAEMAQQKDAHQEMIEVQQTQNNLQQQVTEIQTQQKDLLRLERLPELEIAERAFDGDQLDVVISNYGKGLAKNVRFVTTLQPANRNGFEPSLTGSRARRVDDSSEATLERSLRPHEDKITFRGVPKVRYRFQGTQYQAGDFTTVFQQLSAHEINSVWFQIYVVVDDQLGGCQMKPLFWPARNPDDLAKYFDIEDEQVDLETAYNEGGLMKDRSRPNLLQPDCRE